MWGKTACRPPKRRPPAKARCISNPMMRMPFPLTGSSIRRELAGNTTSTDPRSQRIRESRKGRPCNELGLSAPVYRRPARTFVLPARRVPDGLTITLFFEKHSRMRKAPRITYRITASASASTRPCSTSFTVSRSAKRCTVQSMSCRPISMSGFTSTMRRGHIKDAGASARRRCKRSSTQCR